MKKSIAVIATFSLIFSLLIDTYSKEKSKIERKMKAVFGLKADLTQFPNMDAFQVAEELASWGVNAVFGGSSNRELVEALHKKGIKVYEEIGIFVGEKYWKRNPESRPITDKGVPIEKDEWYCGVCPNQDWLREEKLNEIKKLAFQADGVWLDFIRYPCHWEVKNPRFDRTCFCPICLTKFQRDTGIKIPENLSTVSEKARWILKEHKTEWNKWRCEQITNFVKEARRVLKETNPQAVLGLFGVPWQPADFDNAIIEYIAQDYKELAKFVDIFSPMVYHKMCYRDIKWITEITNYLAEMTKKKIVPIIQACSVPSELDKEEFKKAIEAGLAGNSSGVIIFTLDYVMKEKKIDVMKSTFHSSN